MKSTHYISAAAFIVIAVLVSACSATSSDDKKAQLDKLKAEQANLSKQIQKLESEIAKTNPDSAAVKSKLVSLAEVKVQPFNHYVQTQGAVESEQNVQVSAKSMGIVTQILITEGQTVSKGQT